MANDADRSKQLLDLHNKGEQDAKTNHYDGPRDGLLEHIILSQEKYEELQEEVHAYQKGWENGWKQR